MKEKTYDEIVIDNANDVLNSPMTYPTFAQYKRFHTNELSTRSMWLERKKAAEERIKEAKIKQQNEQQ